MPAGGGSLALCLGAMVLVTVGCQRSTPAPEGPKGPRFERVPATGVDVRIVNGDPDAPHIIDAMGTGACLLDHDADGFLDVFVVNGSTLEQVRRGEGASCRLYRNRGDWTFEDVTERSGVSGRGWGQGCAVADVDGNGLPDLYVTALGPNLLYLNRGEGRFEEAPGAFGAADPHWSAGAAFADLDRDGRLDLYVTNYVEVDLDDLPAPHGGRRSYQKLVEVFAGPQGLTAAPDSLYRGREDGSFEDVSVAWGAREPEASYGLAVLPLDADADGSLDLYVANDSQPNFLFLNEGNGELRETGLLSGAALAEDGRSQAGMGLAAADLDDDGLEELFVTNFDKDSNTLYWNLGGGRFRDATAERGLEHVSHARLGWGTHFFDADLDGRLDLFIANGHVYPQVEGLGPGSEFAQLNQLLVQGEDGRFEERAPREGGSGLEARGVSRGLACGDLDNDGDLDLVVVNLNGGVDLLRNDSERRGDWIGFSLEPGPGRPDPTGAIVRLRQDDGRARQATMRTAGSYLSAHDPRVHFGLGAAEAGDVSVLWPGGEREEFGRVEPGAYHRLRRGSGRVEPAELPRRAPAEATLAVGSVAGQTVERAAGGADAVGGDRVAADLSGLGDAELSRRAHEAASHGRFEEAIAIGEELVRRRPEEAAAHHLLGSSAFASGRLALADRHLEIAADLAPRDPEVLLKHAEYLLNARRLDEARETLEGVLGLQPDDGVALYLLGLVHAEAGRHADASSVLRRAAALVPAPAKVWMRVGLSELALGRLAEAEEAFGRSLEHDGSLLGSRYGLEISRARRGGEVDAQHLAELGRLSQLEAGLSHQQALVAAAPNNDAHRYRLASLLAEAGRCREARIELVTVLRRRPAFLEALLLHADCSLELGDLQSTRQALAAAGRVDRGSARMSLLRGRLHLAEGEARLARSAFEDAVAADPRAVEPLEELARLWLEGGPDWEADADRALDQARRAWELGSTDALLVARCLAAAGAVGELEALLESPQVRRESGERRREIQSLVATARTARVP